MSDYLNAFISEIFMGKACKQLFVRTANNGEIHLTVGVKQQEFKE